MVKTKIKQIIAASGLSYRKLSDAFNCSENTAAGKFSRGIKSINDLIIICDYCKATITITLQDGTVIPLTKADIEQEQE